MKFKLIRVASRDKSFIRMRRRILDHILRSLGCSKEHLQVVENTEDLWKHQRSGAD